MKTPIPSLRIHVPSACRALVLLPVVLLFLALTPRVRAATFIVWNGAGGNGNWSTAANWNPATTFTINTFDALEFNGLAGLINTNDFAGDTNNGLIFQPAAGPFVLNPGAGGVTLVNGDINNQSTNTQVINQNIQINAANHNVFTHNGASHVGDIIFNGVISQDATGRGLTFQPSPGNYQIGQGQGSDAGNATLAAANTYSGTTSLGLANGNNGATSVQDGTINNTGFGTLTLDFTGANAPVANILYNGVATPGQLSMNGATLLIKGANGAANTQQFGNLVYDIGENRVQLAAGSGGSVAATFGTIGGLDNNNSARAGSVNFVLGANTSVTTTSANTAVGGGGILANGYGGAHILLNGTDWAANDGSGNVVPYTGYQVDATGTANAHVDVQNSDILTASVATLRFNQNASLSVSNGGSYLLGNDAILITPKVGNNTNTLFGTGSLGGIGGRSFAIFNYDANGVFVISAPFSNNDAGAQNTFCGPGLTMLTASTDSRTQAGVNAIIGKGRLFIGSNTNLGIPSAGAGLTMEDGTLLVNSTFALDNNNGGGLNARTVAFGNHGGTFDVGGTNTLTISGPVLGQGGLTKTDSGVLLLKGAISYAGNTFVKQGTLAIATAPSGTGGLFVSDGATLIDQGSLSIKPVWLGLGATTGCTNTFTGVSSTTTAPIAAATLDANGITVINVTGVGSVGVYPLISFNTNIGTGNFVVGSLPLGVAGNIVTNNGTNIALNVTSTGSPDVWKGNINNLWNIGSTANWFLNNSIAYSDGSLVRFDDTASQFNVDVAANVAPGGVTMTNQQHAYIFSGPDAIGGSGSLIKTGTNSLTIAVNYAATGGINVQAGTLIIGDGTTNGTVTGSSIVDNGAVVFDRDDTNEVYAAGISGGGPVTIDANTNGIITLGGNNSYQGNTIVQSGTLNAGGAGVIPNGAGDGILVVDQSGVLNVNGDLLTVNGLSGLGLIDNQTAFSDPNGNGLNFTVGGGTATNSTFAGSLTNSVQLLNLVMTGTGTLFLAGTNYNTGMYIFDAGIVNAATFSDYSDAGTPNSGPSAIGNRPYSQENASNNRIGLWFRDGTLQYTGSTPQQTDRMIRLFNGTSSIDASGSNPGANLQFTWNDASINFYENPGTRTLRLTGSNTGANAFTIHLRDQTAATGLTSVIKDGPGTWYLTNSVTGQAPLGAVDSSGNSYTGPTSVSNGVLYVSTGSGDVSDDGLAGGVTGTIGGSPYTVYDGATLGLINLDNSYRVAGQSLTNNGATTLRFANVDNTTLPVSYFASVAVNGTTIISLDDTNNLVAGNTYPLIAYGTLAGAFSLTPLPAGAGIYGVLTNDTANSWIALIVTTNSPAPVTPPQLSAKVSGGTLTLSWPANYTGYYSLQAQTNSLATGLGGNWVAVPGTAANNSYSITVDPQQPAVFYRLVSQ
jgi:autotransporter-associated beta strand protein